MSCCFNNASRLILTLARIPEYGKKLAERLDGVVALIYPVRSDSASSIHSPCSIRADNFSRLPAAGPGQIMIAAIKGAAPDIRGPVRAPSRRTPWTTHRPGRPWRRYRDRQHLLRRGQPERGSIIWPYRCPSCKKNCSPRPRSPQRPIFQRSLVPIAARAAMDCERQSPSPVRLRAFRAPPLASTLLFPPCSKKLSMPVARGGFGEQSSTYPLPMLPRFIFNPGAVNRTRHESASSSMNRLPTRVS